MALWKPFRGSREALEKQPLHDGYVYFCTNDGSLHFDFIDANGDVQRKQISSNEASSLIGYDISPILSYSNTEIPTAKAVADAIAQKSQVQIITFETSD